MNQDAYNGQFNLTAQQQAAYNYRPPPSPPPPPTHYIQEREHGPAYDTPCGLRLWEVVRDDLVTGVDVGEFRVHPLTASGRLDSVDCLACLRALAKRLPR